MSETEKVVGAGAAARLLIDLPRLVTEMRLRYNVTQQEIAAAVGCHRNSISSFERGAQKLPYDLAARILQWVEDVQQEETEG